MQPILVISPRPELAEACRHSLPDTLFQVFHEPDWLQALELAAYRPVSAILVDVSDDQVDAFMIGRILWLRTRRPILLVDGDTDLRHLVAVAAAFAGGPDSPAHRLDPVGRHPVVEDDRARDRRTATRPPVAADLVRRAPRRFG